jgi:tRNA-2-methylthio-N6-dimethylallyladenosine synthase
LAALQESISWEENLALVGRSLEVMITGSGRKDQATSRVSGRAQDNRLVHIAAGELALKSGDFVTAEITQAAPHHLLADGPVAVIARYARPESDGCATPAGSPGTVALGLPGVGPVAPTPVA